jgi:hypothetical protein
MRFFLILFLMMATSAVASAPATGEARFPPSLESYDDGDVPGLWAKLSGRVAAEPFNLVATVIFLLAICHTFLSSRFLGISNKLRHRYEKLEKLETDPKRGSRFSRLRDWIQVKMTAFHFLGEVEAVFGIWLIPLAIAVLFMAGLDSLFAYIDSVSFTEPIFVVVIMTVASSRPVLRFAEWALARVAALGGSTPSAWWLSIMTVGPLLGSFVTEPAAMTICALLLVERFYKLKPSMTFRYATLGLLFVNISVGGTLDHFAAPPVVMVASKWGWDFSFMLMNFGWKAVAGILVANGLFFVVFRRELAGLAVVQANQSRRQKAVPHWITFTHLLFIGWIVFVAHHPALVVLGFLFFLAFVQATERNQDIIRLRSPLLVGFFLASLVIHGGFQAWWIAPILGNLGEFPLMIGATVLTAFNDNAAITYLATLVPGLSEELKYAVVAGAVAGGGLTVIANAPNPAGQAILQKYFGENGIDPAKLFLAALVPTIIMGAAFMLLP